MSSTAASAQAPLLAADHVSKHFGALVVLDGVDFEVGVSESVGIVGPNGAGKTTLLDVLAGAQAPTHGAVRLSGRDISRVGAAGRVRLGVGRSHQVPRPFGGMTVFENVLTGAFNGGRRRGRAAYEISTDALEQTGLAAVANRRAETLGLLARKRLELARALATDPKVLLLDEIAGGLTDEETVALVSTIRDVRSRGVAVVWIEHIVHVLLQVAERLVCMSQGRVIAAGEPRQVMSDPLVISTYLGSAPE
jgi:branched-chain amino acid transport system ATP-binding protein